MSQIKIARTDNAKRSIKFGLILKMISLVIPFISRMLMIRLIGAEYLGLGSLFTSILQVLNLAELGFATAVVYFMYDPIAHGDNEELGALLLYYRKIYRTIGLIILTSGIVFMPFLPKLINGTPPSGVNLYAIYLIFLANTVVTYFWMAYRGSLFYAHQRNDVLDKVNIAVFLGEQSLQVLSLVLTRNIYIFYALRFVATLINNSIIGYYSRKYYPNVLKKGSLSIQKKKEIITKVKGLMVNKISLVSRNAFDSIFVSAFIGLIDTAKYNNYYYVITTLTGLTAILRSAIAAGVGNSLITETQEKNHSDLRKMDFLYMWIIGWFTACMICLYQPFTRLVFGENMLYSKEIMIAFSSYFYVMRMGDIRYVYSEAKGLWWENRYRSIGEAVANIILNYVLGYFFGVMGIILATLVSIIVFNYIWSTLITYKYCFPDISVKGYYLIHCIYTFTTCIVCAICFEICSIMPIMNPIISLMFNGIIVFLFPNILFFLMFRWTKIYRESFSWIIDKFRFPKSVKQILLGKNSTFSN